MQKRTTSLPGRPKPEYLVQFLQTGENLGNPALYRSFLLSLPSSLLLFFLSHWGARSGSETHLQARSPLSFCLIPKMWSHLSSFQSEQLGLHLSLYLGRLTSNHPLRFPCFALVRPHSENGSPVPDTWMVALPLATHSRCGPPALLASRVLTLFGEHCALLSPAGSPGLDLPGGGSRTDPPPAIARTNTWPEQS